MTAIQHMFATILPTRMHPFINTGKKCVFSVGQEKEQKSVEL